MAIFLKNVTKIVVLNSYSSTKIFPAKKFFWNFCKKQNRYLRRSGRHNIMKLRRSCKTFSKIKIKKQDFFVVNPFFSEVFRNFVKEFKKFYGEFLNFPTRIQFLTKLDLGLNNQTYFRRKLYKSDTNRIWLWSNS